jgi:hypothetical protein
VDAVNNVSRPTPAVHKHARAFFRGPATRGLGVKKKAGIVGSNFRKPRIISEIF